MKFRSTLLTFSFALGTFKRWLQNFGFICTDSKFWSFELGDGESSKSQYRSYLEKHVQISTSQNVIKPQWRICWWSHRDSAFFQPNFWLSNFQSFFSGKIESFLFCEIFIFIIEIWLDETPIQEDNTVVENCCSTVVK